MNTRVFRQLSTWAALALSACLFDTRQAGRGTIVDNEVGFIYLKDGEPAVNARVMVFAVAHVPDSSDPAFSTRTDASGRYMISSIPEGEYNILGELDGYVSYQDSVRIERNGETIPPDTLDQPGAVAGWVAVEPNHDPRSVTVQVLGTNNYANVDAKGFFRLENLARGHYPLRLVTTLPEYTPLHVHITATSSRSDTLDDTLRLPFTGIPVVRGLKAEYDTLRGVVRLSWQATDYRDLSEYLIYRDTALSLELSEKPIGQSVDTVFADTVRLPSSTGLFPPDDKAGHALEYRVRIRGKTDKIGLNYGKVVVNAAPLDMVRPAIEIRIDAIRWDSMKQADSIRAVARVKGLTRPLRRITWSVVGDSVLRYAPASGLGHMDTLNFGWAKEGPFLLRVQVVDEAGTTWPSDFAVAGNSAPVLVGHADSLVKSGERYLFKAQASDTDHDSLFFSATNLPRWAVFNAKDGSIEGVPSDTDTGRYAGIILRVTDGRRTAALPAFNIIVKENPWHDRKSMLSEGKVSSAISLDGKVYVVQTNASRQTFIDEYSPSEDAWTRNMDVPTGWILARGGGAVAGKLILFGWSADTATRALTAFEADPAAKTWKELGSHPAFTSAWHAVWVAAPSDGKFHVFHSPTMDEYAVLEYDPGSGQWSSKPPVPDTFGGSYDQAAVTASGIYLTRSFNPGLARYRLADGTWEAVKLSSRQYGWWDMSLWSSGGKIFAAGGTNGQDSWDPDYKLVSWMEAYDPMTDAWQTMKSLRAPGAGYACLELAGKVYFFGGSGNGVQEYNPDLDQ